MTDVRTDHPVDLAATAPETRIIPLDTGWLFGGEVPRPGAENLLDPEAIARVADPAADDSSWQSVTLPHTVTPLSWRSWNPATWEKVWAYRLHLDVPADTAGARLFIEFDAAMTCTTVTLDGQVLGTHDGGYLPFEFEITDLVTPGSTPVIGVVLDSRFTVNVPPNPPAPAPTSTIDYLQPGGIHRSARLRIVPATFIASVALTNTDVLDPGARATTALVTIDSTEGADAARLTVSVRDASGALVASSTDDASSVPAGRSHSTITVRGLNEVTLWDTVTPTLYTVEVQLESAGEAVHRASIRTGYRDACFREDGFFLNGVRTYLIGVNRHGYFPFAGFAMPDRVHRRDAEMLKNELNCVMVRCSHYPQTASFLDACDELGLLVWEESPGWQYVGDDHWRDLAAADIENMIARDRHRPSIVVWGARLNETPDRPDFYARTEALVKRLDPSRATSGTMFGSYARSSTFQHDVFSYDDYETDIYPSGERHPILLDPIPGRPYLVSEAISTRSSPTTFYLRSDGARVQQHQALDYAIGHNIAMGDARFAGLIAWVGFDYQANMGNHHRGIKTSGLGDVFREWKPGSAIYRSQVHPAKRAVIAPAFTWDPPEFGQANSFGDRPEGRMWGPGERAMICSNLDRLDVYLGTRLVEQVTPDREQFPHLPYAPSFVDLRLLEGDDTDLRIDGFIGDTLAATVRLSGDRSNDTLALVPDDELLVADGADSTRVAVRLIDRFGVPRGSSQAVVQFGIDGPGTFVGDDTIDLSETGGVAAVWVRTRVGETGDIRLTATAFGFGNEVASITVIPA